MPMAAPIICACGKAVPRGVVCPCRKQNRAEAKARADKRRPNAYARGYNDEWRRESKSYLANNPRCQFPGCNAYATVVHHMIAHRGDAIDWIR